MKEKKRWENNWRKWNRTNDSTKRKNNQFKRISHVQIVEERKRNTERFDLFCQSFRFSSKSLRKTSALTNEELLDRFVFFFEDNYLQKKKSRRNFNGDRLTKYWRIESNVESNCLFCFSFCASWKCRRFLFRCLTSAVTEEIGSWWADTCVWRTKWRCTCSTSEKTKTRLKVWSEMFRFRQEKEKFFPVFSVPFFRNKFREKQTVRNTDLRVSSEPHTHWAKRKRNSIG